MESCPASKSHSPRKALTAWILQRKALWSQFLCFLATSQPLCRFPEPKTSESRGRGPATVPLGLWSSSLEQRMPAALALPWRCLGFPKQGWQPPEAPVRTGVIPRPLAAPAHHLLRGVCPENIRLRPVTRAALYREPKLVAHTQPQLRPTFESDSMLAGQKKLGNMACLGRKCPRQVSWEPPVSLGTLEGLLIVGKINQ